MTAHRHSIWEEDSTLSKNIRPEADLSGATGDVLLTGATGYLGRHVLTELLASGRRVHCLARSKQDVSANERVLATQPTIASAVSGLGDRLLVYEADFAAERLGLADPLYRRLARDTTLVIHCAADVSWSRNYAALRAANVLPVAQLLHFAASGSHKHFCLVSTMAVGYSRATSASTDEDTDPWTYMNDIPLGYAQSKCVAERLVRHAANNGLSASIVRPALLLSSYNGHDVNSEDFVSWMIQGCVRLGYAPDADWRLDVVPVDYAAKAVARYARPYPGLRVLHVAHPKPRDWREVVLFLNLFGYKVHLEPFDDWCSRLTTCDLASLPLRRFIGFFTSRPYGDGTTSQIYECQGPPRVYSNRSLTELQRLDLTFPELDAHYFGRYLSALVRAGLLSAPSQPASRRSTGIIDRSMLRALLPVSSAPARIDPATLQLTAFRAASSISTEISSWRFGGPIGLYGFAECGADSIQNHVDLVLKVHPLDAEKLDTAVNVASACSDRLGTQFTRFRELLEFSRSAAREMAFYSLDNQTIRHHSPRCYAIGRDSESGRAMLLMERLKNVELMDSADRPHDWTYSHLQCAIRDLAAVHATWYGRTTELSDDVWTSSALNARTAIDMKAAWSALCAHAKPLFAKWGGEGLVVRMRDLLHTLEDWMPRYQQQPVTLIHNDCNPRNLAFRRNPDGLMLCLYDWELSAIAPPQRDAAELLCFVLDSERAHQVWSLVDLHRIELARKTGVPIDAMHWREGFALALQDLLLRRLTLYTMLHSFARQTFLPRVLRSWKALDGIASAFIGHDALESNEVPQRSQLAYLRR